MCACAGVTVQICMCVHVCMYVHVCISICVYVYVCVGGDNSEEGIGAKRRSIFVSGSIWLWITADS